MGLRAHEEEETHRTRSKWMWGCCGGLVGISVVAVVGLGIFIYLMVRSQPVVPPETFFQPQSDAMAIIQLRPEHHSLATLIQQMAHNPPEGLNMTDKQKAQLKDQAGQIPSQLSEITPIQIVLLAKRLDESRIVSQGPSGVQWEFLADFVGGMREKRFSVAAAASLKSYGGFLNWALSAMIDSFVDRGGHTEPYKGVDVGVPPEENFYLAARDNNFLVADQRDVMHSWIDVLDTLENEGQSSSQDEHEYTGPPDLKEIYQRLESDAPLLFCTSNTNGEIAGWMKVLQSMQSDEGEQNRMHHVAKWMRDVGLNSSAVTAVAGDFVLETEDAGVMNLYVQCEDTPAASHVADQMVQSIGKIPTKNLELQVQDNPHASMVHVTLQITNLEQLIRNAVRGKEG